jgi:comEA protein
LLYAAYRFFKRRFNGTYAIDHQKGYSKGAYMKIVYLLLVAVFACTLSLSSMPGEASAASKAGVAATNQKKSVTKVKKEIPHDVNINTADKQLLTQLPGIGPVTADTILKYRKNNGEFKSIDELTKVKGIGDKTLAKLKPYLFRL